MATDISTHLQHYASSMLACWASPAYMRRCVAVWKDAYGEKVARGVEAIPTPAGAICKALRARGIEAQPADPRVLMLAEQGVDLATVDAAALEARQAKGQDRIPVGYVLSILERWSQEAQQRRVSGAQAPPKGGAMGRIAETVAAFTGFGAAGGNEDDGRVFDGHAQRVAG